MKDVDKLSERELRREVKALREGSCRFNCRSVKDAFYAGFDAARKTGNEPLNDCVCVYDTAKEAYRDWHGNKD